MNKIDYNREGDDKGVRCLKCPPRCLDRFARQRFSRRKFAKQQSHPQPTTSCRRNNQKAFLCFETLLISLIYFFSEQIIKNPSQLWPPCVTKSYYALGSPWKWRYDDDDDSDEKDDNDDGGSVTKSKYAIGWPGPGKPCHWVTIWMLLPSNKSLQILPSSLHVTVFKCFRELLALSV